MLGGITDIRGSCRLAQRFTSASLRVSLRGREPLQLLMVGSLGSLASVLSLIVVLLSNSLAAQEVNE